MLGMLSHGVPRRRFVALPAYILTGFLGSPAVQAEDFSVGTSVVQVHALPSRGGRVMLGSGVVMEGRKVVTNCHILREAAAVAFSKGALRFSVSGVRADVFHDLCLLEVPTLTVSAARLGDAGKLRKGDSISLFGFPRAVGTSLSRSIGKVTGLFFYQGGRLIQTSAYFAEGSSGGGVFDDSGKLVGISTFFSREHLRKYFAIPVNWISGTLRKSEKPVQPLKGIPFWADPQRRPSFLRIR